MFHNNVSVKRKDYNRCETLHQQRTRITGHSVPINISKIKPTNVKRAAPASVLMVINVNDKTSRADRFTPFYDGVPLD